MRARNLFPAAIAATLLLVGWLVGSSKIASAQTTPPVLFEQIDAGPSLMLPRGARVRRRVAKLNQTLVDSIADAAPATPVLTLNLFPNVVYTAVLDGVEDTNPGRAWTGRLEGEPLSSVVLAVVAGVLAGHVSVPGALYEITGGADGTVVIAEVDPSLLPPEGPPVVVPAVEALPTTPTTADAATRTRITVGIAYTRRARVRAGGVDNIKAVIAAAVAQANMVFRLSGVKLRIRAVFVRQITYRESGDMHLDLTRLQRTNDRIMDTIHRWRDHTRADLVHLIVSPNRKFCGVAYLLRGNLPSFGFGVTGLNCLTSFTLTHELGHNLGAHHDWYVNNDAGAFPYSHGYVNVKRRFRTVMAYYVACADRRVWCRRIPFFSNPSLRLEGKALGVRRTARTNCQTGKVNPRCAADNRATLNKTRRRTSSFR